MNKTRPNWSDSFWPVAHMGFVRVGMISSIGPKFLFFLVTSLVIDIFNDSSIIFDILGF